MSDEIEAVPEVDNTRRPQLAEQHRISTSSTATHRAAVYLFGRLTAGVSAVSPRYISSVGVGHVTDVAAGYSHAILISEQGGAYGLGGNHNGQLGLGTRDSVMEPVRIAALRSLSVWQVACGECHSLFLVAPAGKLYSCGADSCGQLGHGRASYAIVDTPHPVFAQCSFKAVAAGSRHSVAIEAGQLSGKGVANGGQLYAWGDGRDGRLGLGDDSCNVWVPVQVVRAPRCVAVACGVSHTAVISEAGELWAWGDGGEGRLGHGDESPVFFPKIVQNAESHSMVAVAAGERHTLAVDVHGSVFAWGRGLHGRLGLGEEYATSDVYKPSLVSLGSWSNAREVVSENRSEAQPNLGCVSLLDEDVTVAEGNKPLLLEESMTTEEPFDSLLLSSTAAPPQMPMSSRARTVAAGGEHSVVVTHSGEIFTMGCGSQGQLGQSTMSETSLSAQRHSTMDSAEPRRVMLPSAGVVRAVGCSSAATIMLVEFPSHHRVHTRTKWEGRQVSYKRSKERAEEHRRNLHMESQFTPATAHCDISNQGLSSARARIYYSKLVEERSALLWELTHKSEQGAIGPSLVETGSKAARECNAGPSKTKSRRPFARPGATVVSESAASSTGMPTAKDDLQTQSSTPHRPFYFDAARRRRKDKAGVKMAPVALHREIPTFGKAPRPSASLAHAQCSPGPGAYELSLSGSAFESSEAFDQRRAHLERILRERKERLRKPIFTEAMDNDDDMIPPPRIRPLHVPRRPTKGRKARPSGRRASVQGWMRAQPREKHGERLHAPTGFGSAPRFYTPETSGTASNMPIFDWKPLVRGPVFSTARRF